MTTIKASPKGELLLPKEILDAHDIPEGAEVEVSGGRRQIVLSVVERKEREKSLSVEEFLARRPKYDGPPLTQDLIDKAILDEAARRWHEKNSR